MALGRRRLRTNMQPAEAHYRRLACAALRAALPVLLLIAASLFWAKDGDKPLQVILTGSRETAEQVLRRLQGGESFAELAKKYSTDPSASSGGYLGTVTPSDLRPELRDVVNGLAPGQVSGIVATASGFLIARIPNEPQGSSRDAAPAGPEFVAAISGFEDVAYAVSRYPKPPGFEQNLEAICQVKREAIAAAIHEYEKHLGSANFEAVLAAHHALGQLWSYQGDMAKAIEHLEAAYAIAASKKLREYELAMLEKLAVAHMRRGEMENCMQNHNAASCIFPLRPEARHKLPSGSQNAIRYFSKYLEQNPSDLEVRWLLNVAHMTLGSYPSGVPEKLLIPPQAFASQEDIGRFTDVAPALKLDGVNTAGGTIVDDFDNDGNLDIVLSVVDACSPMRYFHNNGDGTFADWSAKAKLSGQLGGINAIQTDYNNDGRLDIFVMRGGWEFPMRNSLLRNNADGTFTDVTKEAGLAERAFATPTAAWADFDNDGCVDVFVGHERAPSQLFRNRCDGTFEDVSARAGVDRTAFTKGSVWGDYDNDGYPDLYVSNFGQPNFLYHNNRNGTFAEVSGKLGVEKPIFSFPAWFWDYNNDGCLDLFVSSYVQSVSEVARGYLNLPAQAETMKLYRNNCRGGFEDVTREAGLERVLMPMGSNFGDLDNDGYPDFYLGTGAPSYAALVPNVLYHNRGGKSFADITSSSGTGHLQKGHGVAFADLNNDGNEDIFLHVGGAVPGDNYGNVLFRNPGHRNHWIRLRLVGVKTNRAAIGARVKAALGERAVYAQVGSGGSFGANPLEQQLGLGASAEIEQLEVWWPTSNTHQAFEHVKADQFLEITELQKTYRRVAHRTYPLGTPGAPASHHH